ncbi:MAG TPA: Holliday junction branch migration protein RuvA [Dehalococcoidia bacterium]|nr:Holliday junction branch migration protein RuvA [Dehalococcoidia bacterium]
MSPIARLRGVVAAVGPDWVVVDVAGVGFKASVPSGLCVSLTEGRDVTLYTHLLVREDGMALYGFETPTDLEVFEQLISVSGVGPRAALALLSAMSARELATAVVQGDVARLRAVPGIGEKTAGRLVLDLQARLAPLAVSGDGAVARPAAPRPDEDVVAALVSLGYSQAEATAAAAEAGDADRPLEERIRRALAWFARKP